MHKKRLTILGLATGLVMSINVFNATVAASDTRYDTAEEAFIQPLTTHSIALDAPFKAWGIRSVAAFIDRNVDGLRIYRNRYGTPACELHPEAVCIPVQFYSDTARGAAMAQTWTMDTNDKYIFFNEGSKPVYEPHERRRAACHELLHVLGFKHHEQMGCVGIRPWGNWTNPSKIEMHVLRGYYNGEF